MRITLSILVALWWMFTIPTDMYEPFAQQVVDRAHKTSRLDFPFKEYISHYPELCEVPASILVLDEIEPGRCMS